MRATLGTMAVGGATLALLTLSTRAHAAPTARLVYSRTAEASSCPDEAALRRAVSARVGYDVFFPWAPRTVVVAIVRRQRAFVATVSLVDEGGIDHGAHELHSDVACVDLLDTVALAVAIAIDPQSLLAAPASSNEAPPPPPPPDPLPLTPMPAALEPGDGTGRRGDEESERKAPTSERVRLEASLGAVVSLGMAPSPAVGTTLDVGFRWSRFSLAIEGAIDAPASEAVSAGGRASAWLAYGALVPCASLGVLFGCAVVRGGSLESSGEGVLDTKSASNAWWAIGGRVGALLPVTGPLRLRLRADLVGDLQPTTLRLDGATAWPAPVVAGSLGIDAVVRFW